MTDKVDIEVLIRIAVVSNPYAKHKALNLLNLPTTNEDNQWNRWHDKILKVPVVTNKYQKNDIISIRMIPR